MAKKTHTHCYIRSIKPTEAVRIVGNVVYVQAEREPDGSNKVKLRIVHDGTAAQVDAAAVPRRPDRPTN